MHERARLRPFLLNAVSQIFPCVKSNFYFPKQLFTEWKYIGDYIVRRAKAKDSKQ